jgi:hypothetical protein
MRRFFHELSPEARRHRFFISGEVPDTLIGSVPQPIWRRA